MNVEIGTVVALVLGVLVVFFKNKAASNKQAAVLAETQGQDKILKENQDAVRREIQEADNTIVDLQKEREKLRKQYEDKTRQEKADEWNKK